MNWEAIENDVGHEEIGAIKLGPADPDAALYGSQKDDETPDADAVATTLTIEDHRRGEKVGGKR